MSKTLGRWEQQTPFTDGQFVRSASFSLLGGAVANLSSPSAGLLYANLTTASTTFNFYTAISELQRTGQLATSGVNQEFYGTAANVPGPSIVAGTSDPLALPPGFPPWLNSVNPALTGGNTNAGVKGPIPKGVQYNFIDVLYGVDVAAITTATIGLTQTKMPVIGTPAAPIVTNLIALGVNGLPVALNSAGQVTRTRVLVPTPAFTIADAAEVILNINFTTSATGTVRFYGAVIGATFNYN